MYVFKEINLGCLLRFHYREINSFFIIDFIVIKYFEQHVEIINVSGYYHLRAFEAIYSYIYRGKSDVSMPKHPKRTIRIFSAHTFEDSKVLMDNSQTQD